MYRLRRGATDRVLDRKGRTETEENEEKGERRIIRTLVERAFTAEKKYVELFGLSTDSKPITGIVTGSKYTEVNTGDEYLFDEAGDGTWTKVKAGYVAPTEQ